MKQEDYPQPRSALKKQKHIYPLSNFQIHGTALSGAAAMLPTRPRGGVSCSRSPHALVEIPVKY